MDYDDVRHADQTNEGYGIDEAAARLSISPATLRFWEETFREELNVRRKRRGELVFSDCHLTVIERIQRMVLNDGVSLDEARAIVRSEQAQERETDPHAAAPDPPAPQDSNGEVEENTDTPQGKGEEQSPAFTARTDEAQEAADRHGLGSNRHDEVDELKSAVDGLSGTVREIGALVARLQEDMQNSGNHLVRVCEEVGFIVEENRALQELISRLIERVDELGASRERAPAPPEPRETKPVHEGVQDDQASDTERANVQTGPGTFRTRPSGEHEKPIVKPWLPGDLGPSVQRADFSNWYSRTCN